jgi:ribosomal protein S6--L-glutamate ligase
MKKLNILILSTGNPSKRLIKAIESRGHTYECYSPKELYLLVSDSKNGKDRLFVENGTDTPKELFPKNFNAVMTRLGGGGDYGLTVLQHLTDNIGLYSAQTAGSIRIASNKMWTSQKVSAAGLNTPVTVFAKNPKNIPFLITPQNALRLTSYRSYKNGGLSANNGNDRTL